MRLILPYIFALVSWVVYFTVIHWPQGFFYVLIFFIAWYLFTLTVIAGRRVFSHWNLFLNCLIFYLSVFLFIVIPSPPMVRIIYGLVFGLAGGWITYGSAKYFEHQPEYAARSYLELNQFVYIIGLWQLLAFAFFSMTFLDFILWPWVVFIGIATWLFGREIITLRSLKKSLAWQVLLVLTLTMLELFSVIVLLPIHYFNAATLTVAWFYFVIQLVLAGQELSSRRRLFYRYLWALLLIFLLILVTSAWN